MIHPPQRTATACAHWESNQKKSHFSLSNDAEITQRWHFQKKWFFKAKQNTLKNRDEQNWQSFS